MIDGSSQTPKEAERVLVIDDSEMARAQLRTLLQRAGYEVLEHPSAIGATRMIIANSVKAVILDVSMPGLSGDRFVRVLRDNRRLQNLVIVLVSAKTEAELQIIKESVDVNAVLSKENVSNLVRVLRRHLRRSAVSSSIRPPADDKSSGSTRKGP